MTGVGSGTEPFPPHRHRGLPGPLVDVANLVGAAEIDCVLLLCQWKTLMVVWRVELACPRQVELRFTGGTDLDMAVPGIHALVAVMGDLARPRQCAQMHLMARAGILGDHVGHATPQDP